MRHSLVGAWSLCVTRGLPLEADPPVVGKATSWRPRPPVYVSLCVRQHRHRASGAAQAEELRHRVGFVFANRARMEVPATWQVRYPDTLNSTTYDVLSVQVSAANFAAGNLTVGSLDLLTWFNAGLSKEVETLLAKGASQREIERRTGADRKTIRRYAANSPGAATGSAAEPGQTPPPRPPATPGSTSARLTVRSSSRRSRSAATR